MRVSRTIIYAVYAMLQLAQAPNGAPISRSQLAAVGKLPERFLLEILRSLVAAGLVRSTRGVDGGFSLARPSHEITLGEVFGAFDCPSAPYVPPVEGQCIEVHDQLLATLQSACGAARHELEKLTIDQLVPSGEPLATRCDSRPSAACDSEPGRAARSTDIRSAQLGN
jgi:Rrf2 family protein